MPLRIDNKEYAGVILMDLSKAFDTINHQLMIAKLHAYGFGKRSLGLISSYFKDRFQRTKINTTFSDWTELKKGVPQGSVLGPVLFNIYLNDLFFEINDSNFCNYADDTTLYLADISPKNLLLRLEHDSLLAISWFDNNYMKLNSDKCHLLVSGQKFEHIFAYIGENQIWEDDEVELLGVTIDSQLKFESQMSMLPVGQIKN